MKTFKYYLLFLSLFLLQSTCFGQWKEIGLPYGYAVGAFITQKGEMLIRHSLGVSYSNDLGNKWVDTKFPLSTKDIYFDKLLETKNHQILLWEKMRYGNLIN